MRHFPQIRDAGRRLQATPEIIAQPLGEINSGFGPPKQTRLRQSARGGPRQRVRLDSRHDELRDEIHYIGGDDVVTNSRHITLEPTSKPEMYVPVDKYVNIVA